MKRPKVLIIAEAANPVLTSAALVGWSCAKAISEKADAHIVTHWRNRDDFIKAGMVEGEDFTAIDTRRSQHLAWRTAKLLSKPGALSWSLYAIFSNLVYPLFERELWHQFEGRLKDGEFDVVHRVLPLSPTSPSPIARKLHEIGVPFVIGPLNGGVEWPEAFADIKKAESDFGGILRRFYRFLPGVTAARKYASCILTGSRSTLREIPAPLHKKCIFIPENAIDPARFDLLQKPDREAGPLHLSFVGRLVALKGVDMLIEAAAPLVSQGKVILDIIGDGPERGKLESLLIEKKIDPRSVLAGWVEHDSLQDRLSQSDLFVFPSIREFGGGAVLEAMALGIPAVVLDHGGPPELVPPGTGFILPLKNRNQVVSDLRGVIEKYAADPSSLAPVGKAAQIHISRYFTWEAKADQIVEVYSWLIEPGRKKPEWGIPFGWKKKVRRKSRKSKSVPASI